MEHAYCGRVTRVNGPLVSVHLEIGLQMMEVVYVSELRLIGEVLHIRGEEAVVQVYEDTSGVKPGDEV